MADEKSGFDATTGRSRRDILKAGGSTLALAALGTVAAPAVLRAQAPVIKIGGIGPLTGAIAYNGNQAKAAMQFAIDDANAAGGIKSMGGAKLELLFGDAESRPDVGAAQVDKLAEAGVSVLVGSQSSAISLATTQAAARFNLPQIVDVGTADQIVQRGLPNVFRFSPGTARSVAEGIANLNTLNEQAGKPVKTVAIVHEDGPFGSSMAKLLQEKLPSIGMNVVETISHPTPQRDFTNILLRLKNAKPDLVMPSHYINEFILFARTTRQQRFAPKGIYSIFGGGASNIKFVRENQDAAQFVIDTNHWYDPRKAASQALAKKVADAKLDLTYDIMVAYGATQVAIDAIEKAGSADRAKLIETLSTQTFADTVMPYGPIKFVGGDNTGSHLVNLQVRGDKIEVIFPKEYATIAPVFPIPERS
ncbi:ABC transporter substrate-binding protein [Enterovirga sp. CN4-39]|uniref:ABC transporter substrate-binding protein n=1 Tax=Enterovirga sp. CN4-39 TaxID=3400910 RepID=UPI003C042E09